MRDIHKSRIFLSVAVPILCITSCFESAVGQVMIVRPQSVDWWTGHVRKPLVGGFSDANGAITVGNDPFGTIHRGYAEFDISPIPDNAVITNVVLTVYTRTASGSLNHDLKIVGLTVDPVTVGGASLYNDIGTGAYYYDGTWEAMRSVGYHSIQLNGSARKDIQSRLDQDWWAVGFREVEDNDLWGLVDGWNWNSGNSPEPYCAVTYASMLLWNQRNPLNVSRLRARSEVLNGKVLCIGGRNGIGGQVWNSVEVFQNGIWLEHNARLSVRRYEFASCVLGNQVYIFGGQNEAGVVNIVESFDGSTWVQRDATGIGIYDLDGATFGGSYYTFGGLTSRDLPFTYDNKVRKYSPLTGWDEIQTLPFVPRAGYSCAVVGSYVYVIGGFSGNPPQGEYLSEVRRFNLSNGSWEQRASMSIARADFACQVVDGKIYVIGGVGGSNPSPSTSVGMYDPQNDSWWEVIDHPNLELQRPSSTVLNNRILIVGHEANQRACWESGQFPVSVEPTPPNEFGFMLQQNYPNPFNPRTRITFTIPGSSLTSIKVYDILGREVSTVIEDRLQIGTHVIEFDGGGLRSGVYFYRLRAGNFVQTRKMLLVK